MSTSDALAILQTGAMVAIKIAAPLLLVSMTIGIVISIFQAATQIHEQTITFVPKLILIAVVLIVGGPWMLTTLSEYVTEVFAMMLK